MSILFAAIAAVSAHTPVPQPVAASVSSPPPVASVTAPFNLPASYEPSLQAPQRHHPAPLLSPRFMAPAAERGAISLPSVDWANGNAALKMKVVGLHLGWIF